MQRDITAVSSLRLNLGPLEKGIYHLLVRGRERSLYARFVVE